jgi:hypothetical protein
MIDDIETHLFDLLAGDARLYQAGTAWAVAWKGVKRTDAGVAGAPGYINLFETCYEKDGSVDRPAIYLGLSGFEAQDKLAYETAAAPADHTEGRTLTMPLVLVVRAPTKILARRARNQLRQNVKSILFDHRIETNHWYWLEMSSAGGAARDAVWVTASGGGEQQVAEAMCMIPVVISYMWNGSSPA